MVVSVYLNPHDKTIHIQIQNFKQKDTWDAWFLGLKTGCPVQEQVRFWKHLLYPEQLIKMHPWNLPLSHLHGVLSQPYQSDFWTSVSLIITLLPSILLLLSIKNHVISIAFLAVNLQLEEILKHHSLQYRLTCTFLQDTLPSSISALPFNPNSYIDGSSLKQRIFSHKLSSTQTSHLLAHPS